MKISFNLLTKILLPFHKRQPVRLSFLSIFAQKAKQAMEKLLIIKSETIKSLGITGQTIMLTHHLNNLFGPGISIVHGIQQSLNFGLLEDGSQNYIDIGLLSEASSFRPAALEGENLESFGFDYQVIITPATPVSSLTAELNKYRLAGKTFEIVVN